MSLNQVAEFARSKLGCGYVYGATGWVCSESRRRAQAKQYPQYEQTILNTCKKWDGKQCYDCAQLTKSAVQAAGGSLPSGATSQWNSDSWAEKGEISTLPADSTGLILYRQKDTKMQHTGVSIGGGRVVDSRGSAYGVIETALSSYPWTHWARPRLGVTQGTAETGTVATESKPIIRQAQVTKITGATGQTVRLRKSPSTGADVLRNVPFGTSVGILEESGEWSRFAYGGYEGWMQSKFLPADSAAGASADASSVICPILRRGSKGEDVKRLQALLIACGYSVGAYGADGDFGSATDIAVRKYQEYKGLEINGVAGCSTWAALAAEPKG